MKKVLIADDTKNIRQLLTTCLEHEGYDVVSVENGVEALDAFYNNSFDLAFLDIKMPKISGTEVLRKIRSMGIETPIIIITAFPTVKNAVECTQMNAIAYMQKPFTTNRVKQVLKEIIDVRGQNQSLGELLILAEEKLSNNQSEEALLVLKKVLSIEPTHAYTYYLLSIVYKNMGDIIESQRFEEIFKLFESKNNHI